MNYRSDADSNLLEWAVLISLVLVVVAVFGFSLFTAGGEIVGRFTEGLPR